jgi:hypothetical protein
VLQLKKQHVLEKEMQQHQREKDAKTSFRFFHKKEKGQEVQKFAKFSIKPS